MRAAGAKNLVLCAASILALWIPLMTIELLSGWHLSFVNGFMTLHIIQRFYPGVFR